MKLYIPHYHDGPPDPLPLWPAIVGFVAAIILTGTVLVTLWMASAPTIYITDPATRNMTER
jgi:hypothetical protein